MAYECLIDGGAVLTQAFGCTGYAVEPSCGGCAHYHSGFDLAAPCGRSVRAVGYGTVQRVGWDGYGPYAVLIVSGPICVLYGHLQAAYVRPGDQVRPGQVIGQVGSEGVSSGCHLHYSVRPADNCLTECGSYDPAPYLCSWPGTSPPPSPPPPSPPPPVYPSPAPPLPPPTAGVVLLATGVAALTVGAAEWVRPGSIARVADGLESGIMSVVQAIRARGR
jgi:murein DD-endopeptidase MepM/ murein hydrolase activator NlpD